MSDSVKLEAATAEARIARERLVGTFEELRARLDPPRLLDEVVTSAKAGARDLADNTIAAASRKPEMVAGVAGIIALLLFRRPIARLFRRKRKPPVETTREWYR